MRFTINELSMHIQCIKCSHTKSTLCDSPLFDKADKNRKRFWFGKGKKNRYGVRELWQEWTLEREIEREGDHKQKRESKKDRNRQEKGQQRQSSKSKKRRREESM